MPTLPATALRTLTHQLLCRTLLGESSEWRTGHGEAGPIRDWAYRTYRRSHPGPISDEGFGYAQSCSSRASVSRVRWQNTYSFGDFRGNVATQLSHYDAHFYIANWGTVRLRSQMFDPLVTVELKEQPFAPTLAHKLGDVPHVSGSLRHITHPFRELEIILTPDWLTRRIRVPLDSANFTNGKRVQTLLLAPGPLRAGRF